METLNIMPGDVVATDFGVYQHLSVVSNIVDETGKNKLISATKRTGAVKEENWDLVTQGRSTYKTAIPKREGYWSMQVGDRFKVEIEHYMGQRLGQPIKMARMIRKD